MYTLNVIIMCVAVALLAGVAIGAIIAQRTAPTRKAQHDMEQHLSQMQREQQDYQQEVTEHFTETAELLDQLTESYRDVHNHLAQGAQRLCNDPSSTGIQGLKDDNTKQQGIASDSSEPITPPLDYAPKNTGKGTLHEEFGLEKNAASNEEESPSPTPGAGL